MATSKYCVVYPEKALKGWSLGDFAAGCGDWSKPTRAGVMVSPWAEVIFRLLAPRSMPHRIGSSYVIPGYYTRAV